MAALFISSDIVSRMVSHCVRCLPHEACGLLAGRDSAVERIFAITNIEPSPVSYLMDPAEQFRAMKEMRQEGAAQLAIYHSHPASPAVPSGIDVAQAFFDEAVYIIVGLLDPDKPDIRAYRIVEGKVNEAEIVID